HTWCLDLPKNTSAAPHRRGRPPPARRTARCRDEPRRERDHPDDPVTTHQLVVPVVATLLTGFATAGPASTERADCPTEQTVARAAAARIEREWPLRSTDAVTDFVRPVGRRRAEHAPASPYPWTFTVVRDRSANAFAIGGGAIYVHDGTIAVARDEAEVAAVLAHEMGHQLAGHFCVGRQEDASWSGLLAD